METIEIKLFQETDTDGRTAFWCEYDEGKVKELSFALMSDPILRELTLMTAANIIAHEKNATERWEAMEELIRDIRDEEKEKKVKLHQNGKPYEI